MKKEIENHYSTKCRIEFLIRQCIAFGRILEANYRRNEAEQLASTLMHESCRIILSTTEADGTVIEPVDPVNLALLFDAFRDEFNKLIDYLQEYSGYPITIYTLKLQLGIIEAAEQINDQLIQIIK